MMQPKRQPALDSSHPVRAAAVRDSAILQCLVVSSDESRRESMAWAARDGGWQTATCGDAQTALDRARWMFLQLAIIDLTSPDGGEPTGFRQLVEKLACGSHVLLLTCGNEGDAEQEVWARHLGVWMYLPGATDGDDLASLCGEARAIAQRMAAAKEKIEHTSQGQALYRPS
jgi:DNA-binding NtrC family response regulator